MDRTSSPLAGRLKRPSWKDPRLMIGVVLIAVSVVATSSIVADADRTDEYYSAKSTLTPGTVLRESDVVISHVRVDGAMYVPAGSEPWGSVVTRVIGDGELIPATALADADGYGARPIPVSISQPLAEGIKPGALVDVWLTRDADGVPAPELVAEGVVVSQIDTGEGTFSVSAGDTVYVVVPKAQVKDFLAAIAAEGELSVVGLAGSGAS